QRFPRVPAPAFDLGGPAPAWLAADAAHRDEARPVDRTRVAEAVDGLGDDPSCSGLETRLLVELAHGTRERRLAELRLAAGTRPRPVPVERQPPPEEHATVAFDEHADPVELLRRLDGVTDAHASAA